MLNCFERQRRVLILNYIVYSPKGELITTSVLTGVDLRCSFSSGTGKCKTSAIMGLSSKFHWLLTKRNNPYIERLKYHHLISIQAVIFQPQFMVQPKNNFRRARKGLATSLALQWIYKRFFFCKVARQHETKVNYSFFSFLYLLSPYTRGIQSMEIDDRKTNRSIDINQ